MDKLFGLQKYLTLSLLTLLLLNYFDENLTCSKLTVCLAIFYNMLYASCSKLALFLPGISKFTAVGHVLNS